MGTTLHSCRRTHVKNLENQLYAAGLNDKWLLDAIRIVYDWADQMQWLGYIGERGPIPNILTIDALTQTHLMDQVLRPMLNLGERCK